MLKKAGFEVTIGHERLKNSGKEPTFILIERRQILYQKPLLQTSGRQFVEKIVSKSLEIIRGHQGSNLQKSFFFPKK